MSNVVKRVILFVVSIPFLGMLILFTPLKYYIWYTGLIVILGLIAGFEMRAMFKQAEINTPPWSIFIPALAPILSWLVHRGWIYPEIPTLALTLGITWAFTHAVFASEAEFPFVIKNIGAKLIMVVYPGYFLWWMHEISLLPQNRYAIFVFMLIIFLNDSSAWLIGVLLGKHRDLIAVSPNKSLEGFIAGAISSAIVIVAASRFLPNLLPHSLWQLLFFGIILGITVIIGDLVESALKRAVGVKDSGRVILGRGGILDSIDSCLFTAPLFIIFLKMGRYTLG